MNFFNFFTKRQNVENDTTVAMTVDHSEANANNNEAKIRNEQTPLTVSCATGWPIDIVYGHLNKNYESQGFEDAMLKSDMAFKDMNLNILRNKILMVFREVNLKYDVLKQDTQGNIDNSNAAGLLSTVAELDKRMQIITAHKAELKQLEEDFRNNTNAASIPLQSYECGFLRGIATVALSGNKQCNTFSLQGDYSSKLGIA